MSKNDGTPPEITAILNWQKAHAGQVPYSETASTRLAFDAKHLTSATDCSGMVARMFAHFAGLTVGTWTGNERNYGQLVTTSKADAAAGKGMLPGDVILFNWSGPNPNFDHIAIYAGAGRIWNHGGPGKGPLNWSLASNVNAATNVMVRRFITPTTANAQEDDMNEAQVKALLEANNKKLVAELNAKFVAHEKTIVELVEHHIDAVLGRITHDGDHKHPEALVHIEAAVKAIAAKVGATIPTGGK